MIHLLKDLYKQETRNEKALSKEEREETVQFLEQKDLLSKTNEMIGKSGVIGEETNRLLMYLIFTSRKREHPLHIISLGNSGIGKTYLQEKVGGLDLIGFTFTRINAVKFATFRFFWNYLFQFSFHLSNSFLLMRYLAKFPSCKLSNSVSTISMYRAESAPGRRSASDLIVTEASYGVRF